MPPRSIPDSLPGTLESLLAQWENDSSLLHSSQLPRRMDLLDLLDATFPKIEHESSAPDTNKSSEFLPRANALRSRLEVTNEALFETARSEIQRGLCPATFSPFLQPAQSLPRGNHYDHLDELVSGVLQLDEPLGEIVSNHPEHVFYQPTPARHIFALIRAAALAPSDLLIDLGSGLGHLPLLVSACTGTRAIGIEIEPSYIASARQCAQRLNLSRVSFLEQNARHADLPAGTVFYLYTPFTGSVLRTVLDSLQKEAATRPIRVATFGPCTTVIAQEPWLKATTDPQADRITVFASRA